MIDIASKHIIPAVLRFNKSLSDTVNTMNQTGVETDVPMDMLRESAHLLTETKKKLQRLIEVTDHATTMKEGRDQAVYYYEEVCTAMEALRVPVDKLEMIVDKEMWPMPSYGDLLFEV